MSAFFRWIVRNPLIANLLTCCFIHICNYYCGTFFTKSLTNGSTNSIGAASNYCYFSF